VISVINQYIEDMSKDGMEIKTQCLEIYMIPDWE